MLHHPSSSLADPIQASPSVWQIPVPTRTLPPALVTNTYVIAANGEALIVDFGSAAPAAILVCTNLLQKLHTNRVLGVVATHYHRDHTNGLPQLADKLRIPIYVHAIDLEPARRAMGGAANTAVHELPARFVVGGQVPVDVHHAPGHTHGHVHLVIENEGVILVGDHLAGTGSVWIGPPDGHMDAYYEALAHIRRSGCTVAGPGHGPLLQDAQQAAMALQERRQAREQQILANLDTWRTRRQLFDRVYGNSVNMGAAEVAQRTIMAHLQHLLDAGDVQRRYTTGQGFQYIAVVTPDAATVPVRSDLRSP